MMPAWTGLVRALSELGAAGPPDEIVFGKPA